MDKENVEEPIKNCMEATYYDPSFNRYEEGPGGQLDSNLQPGAIKMVDQNTPLQFTLCLRRVPRETTAKALLNLCKNYGNVLDVKQPPALQTIAFVVYSNITELELALRSINELKPMNIIAEIAKGRQESEKIDLSNNLQNLKEMEQNDIPLYDALWQQREIKMPFSKPITIESKPISPMVDENNYKLQKLLEKDPMKYFLEDPGIAYQEYTNEQSDRRIKGGRMVFKSPPNIIKYMKDITPDSSGIFDCQKNEFTYSSSSRPSSIPIIEKGTCVLCKVLSDKTCKRCGAFYCSLECQRKDWHDHRPSCFPMPDLITKIIHNDNHNNPSNFSSTSPASSIVRDEHGLNASDRKHVIDNHIKMITRGTNEVSINNDSAIVDNQDVVDVPEVLASESIDINKLITTAENEKPLSALPVTKAKNKNNQKVLPRSGLPKNQSKVMLTTVLNNNSCFIRPLDSKSNTEYLRILQDIVEYSENAKPLSGLPNIGDIVLAEFDGKFYRAFVLNFKKDTELIVVGFIDFGNKDLKKLIDLRECDEKLMILKQFITKVTLKDVPKDTGNDIRIADYLHIFLMNSTELQLHYDENQKDLKIPNVELIDAKTKQSINKHIIELSHINEVKFNDKPFFMADLLTIELNGNNLKLLILDCSMLGNAYITCIEVDDAQKLLEYNKKIQPYCQSVHDRYTPRHNELCLVKNDEDNIWYRAVCLEVMGDGRPTVLFVDYGNVDAVKIENIRKIPKEFLFQCRAIGCILDGIPSDDDKPMPRELLQCLKQHIKKNTEIFVDSVITLKENDLKISKIQCNWLLDILKVNNLID